ncbi:TetR/AcrR family transcriptional regulator [Amycolatopsis sp. cmx-4-61]|uniref:TetR/AcrR family transcriptional regulator n=1 Tax=Amycolatopsis sp. cmx-4-61 TaxID=2790937 RepID=UPI00397AFAC5
MPKLWTDTIEAHREAVREAALDATAALVAEHGLTGVKMSQIATKAGIGRATLYKYFPDVEAILSAWHERQIRSHLRQLAEIRDQGGNAGERLEKVLNAYAAIQLQRAQHHRQEPHGAELAALLHPGEHVAQAQHHLHALFRDLLSEAAEAGDIRDDVSPAELANYCLHALTAAGSVPSHAAAHRLVSVTLDGLRRHETTGRQ